jgi:uncharacterized protein YkwD
MRRRFAPFAFAVALAGCATTPPQRPPVATDVEALKARLLALVEQERRDAGIMAKPLAFDPELATAAQAHSNDMAAKDSFDTENPDGNVAVASLLRDPNFQGFVGENAAKEYFSLGSGFDPDMMARGLLAIWMQSPSHRSNILDARFDRTGIGVAIRGNAVFAAEVFATDLGLSQATAPER